MGFDIITWPGYLSITGDVGCFVFSRIDDMFAFFRGQAQHPNLGYWEEKLVAIDRSVQIRDKKKTHNARYEFACHAIPWAIGQYDMIENLTEGLP